MIIPCSPGFKKLEGVYQSTIVSFGTKANPKYDANKKGSLPFMLIVYFDIPNDDGGVSTIGGNWGFTMWPNTGNGGLFDQLLIACDENPTNIGEEFETNKLEGKTVTVTVKQTSYINKEGQERTKDDIEKIEAAKIQTAKRIAPKTKKGDVDLPFA